MAMAECRESRNPNIQEIVPFPNFNMVDLSIELFVAMFTRSSSNSETAAQLGFPNPTTSVVPWANMWLGQNLRERWCDCLRFTIWLWISHGHGNKNLDDKYDDLPIANADLSYVKSPKGVNMCSKVTQTSVNIRLGILPVSTGWQGTRQIGGDFCTYLRNHKQHWTLI